MAWLIQLDLRSINHLALILLISLCLLNTLGCKKAVQSFSDLYALRAELIQEFKERDIDVGVHNVNVLGISFINSSFNNLSEMEREIKAQEIALFARNRYRSSNTIDWISVTFLATSSLAVFHFNTHISSHHFETKNLTRAGLAENEEAPGAAVASYSQETNQISIYLKKNLQLNGAAGTNVTLAPHFAIPAKGVAAPMLAVPDSVDLDFSTASDSRMFQENPQLVIHVDGHKVFSGKAKTMNVMGSNEENSVNEFLSQKISYGQFLQLTNANEVRIELGAAQFELTTEQLKALQDMRKCVEGASCW